MNLLRSNMRFAVLMALTCFTLMASNMADATPTGTVVRLQTSLGPVDIALYDTAAPLTVTNFLKYVNSGAYNNSFIHRSIPGFMIQGGGFTWNNGPTTIPASPPVQNEFSASRSNLRGTIAMAKVGGNPNSATSQWFINLADNSSNLDNQNGGFTVFGQVIGNGMQVVDAIAGLKVFNLSSALGGTFAELPFVTIPPTLLIQNSNLVSMSSVSVVSDTYNSSNNQLTIPKVVVGSATYTNVVVAVGAVASVGAAPAAGTSDTYDGTYLTIPMVSAYGSTYYNVKTTVASVVSVNGH